jgi:hypothetical protein
MRRLEVELMLRRGSGNPVVTDTVLPCLDLSRETGDYPGKTGRASLNRASLE